MLFIDPFLYFGCLAKNYAKKVVVLTLLKKLLKNVQKKNAPEKLCNSI